MVIEMNRRLLAVAIAVAVLTLVWGGVSTALADEDHLDQFGPVDSIPSR